MAKRRKKITKLQKIKKILGRMLATFIANGLATIGAGTLIGVDILSAVLLAGTLGCVKVAEDIARAYLDDGVLTMDEIDEVFGNCKTLPDVLALSDTMILDRTIPEKDGYVFEFVDSPTRAGGVGAYISNHLKYSLRSDLSEF